MNLNKMHFQTFSDLKNQKTIPYKQRKTNHYIENANSNKWMLDIHLDVCFWLPSCKLTQKFLMKIKY